MPLYLNCVHHTILSFFEALSFLTAHDNKAQTQRYIESKRKNRILFEHDKMQQEGDNCSCRMFVLLFAAFCAFEA